MTHHEVDNDKTVRERMAEEETIREKVDKDGNRWAKVYFGGGARFRNWLSWFIELKGEENLEVRK